MRNIKLKIFINIYMYIYIYVSISFGQDLVKRFEIKCNIYIFLLYFNIHLINSFTHIDPIRSYKESICLTIC